jgi:hypothetical protein
MAGSRMGVSVKAPAARRAAVAAQAKVSVPPIPASRPWHHEHADVQHRPNLVHLENLES